eukprot:TRINITY_DN561_c0_g1_i12.p1 TRINITY_DN561_c0_g1~~TRINITY_DN561_c0_g1_i12.p1  ORF type:complete len:120 (+),score=33.17 TRINITY_DN561_c0_g1_i12:189-548(+)
MYKLVGLQRKMLLPGTETVPCVWKTLGRPQYLIDNALSIVLDSKKLPSYSKISEEEQKQYGTKFYDCLFYFGFLVGFPIFEFVKGSNDNKKKGEVLNAKLKEIDDEMAKLLEKRRKKKH